MAESNVPAAENVQGVALYLPVAWAVMPRLPQPLS